MNTNPIPRVPPVTRAVMPWRDHLLSFMLLNFASPIFVSNRINELQTRRDSDVKRKEKLQGRYLVIYARSSSEALCGCE